MFKCVGLVDVEGKTDICIEIYIFRWPSTTDAGMLGDIVMIYECFVCLV